jgi:hypothetical protein
VLASARTRTGEQCRRSARGRRRCTVLAQRAHIQHPRQEARQQGDALDCAAGADAPQAEEAHLAAAVRRNVHAVAAAAARNHVQPVHARALEQLRAAAQHAARVEPLHVRARACTPHVACFAAVSM